MTKNLVKLAEEYCLHYHESQRRKGGNQEPYASHPFAVRDILVRYGYDDEETQAIALLHDTIEDTDLKDEKSEIGKRFGKIIYEGVYVLSNNTISRHAQSIAPLFLDLGLAYADQNGILTPKAYKMRILFSRDSVKRVKIADMTHNTTSLPDLSLKGIERKIKDAEEFYIPLGRCVAPIMVKELITHVAMYKQSEHYKQNFR